MNTQSTYGATENRVEGLVQDEDFAVGTFDRYMLLVWRKRTTPAGAHAARAALTRLYASRPYSPLGFVTLIEEGCSLSVPAEVRDVMSITLKEHNYALGAAAVAYERAGFVSAIVRSVITAINVASRAVFRNHVSSKLVDAVSFATESLGDSANQRQLLEALDSMRSSHAMLNVPRRATGRVDVAHR